MKLHGIIERVICTHQIEREKVIADVGEIAALDVNACRRLLVDLADGEYGGISKKSPPDGACPLQIARMYYYARTAFGESFMPNLRGLIRSIYPDAPQPLFLTRRQATRIIIELDQRNHPSSRP